MRSTIRHSDRLARRLAAAAALALAVSPGVASAQVLGAPEFVFEPGLITLNSVSTPVGLAPGTGFNLRFLARLPTTSTRRVSFVVGVRFAPYGTGNGGSLDNEPVVFYGLDIPILGADWTRGWLTFDLPLLATYEVGGGGDKNPRPFGTDLYAEGAFAMPLGQKVLKDLGPFWESLGLYLRIDHNLTPHAYNILGRSGEEIHLPADRWHPSFQYGLAIPFRWK